MPTDGQGQVCLRLALAAAEADWQVQLLCDAADERLLKHPAVAFQRVPAARCPTQLLRQAAYAARLRRAVDVLRGPDAVVLLNGDAAGSAASDVNVAHFVHSSFRNQLRPSGPRSAYRRLYSELHARGERRAFAAAGVVVAVSNRVREELVADAGVPAEKIRVIPNGVDVSQFRPCDVATTRQLREQVGCDASELLAIFVGDLRSERKGFGRVLEAVAATPGVRLVAVGGHEGGPFPAKAKGLGVAYRVTFLGRRSDVADLLRQADVMTFPSVYEPFGLVVVEALASGVPVICGPEVGAATYVPDEPVLRLRDASDVAGLAGALRTLRDDRESLERLRQRSRASAENVTWTKMTAAYLRLFEKIYRRKVG